MVPVSCLIKVLEYALDSEMLNAIARAVISAQNHREQSWIAHPNIYEGGVYEMDQLEAATKAVAEQHLDTFWAQEIAVWNDSDWNAIQDWALGVITRSKV